MNTRDVFFATQVDMEDENDTGSETVNFIPSLNTYPTSPLSRTTAGLWISMIQRLGMLLSPRWRTWKMGTAQALTL